MVPERKNAAGSRAVRRPGRDPRGGPSGFERAVHAAVRRIPAGRVAAYASVAAMAGARGAARQAGRVLARLPEDTDVPWWRVVRADGTIALAPHSHADRLQRELLRREGVGFTASGRVPGRFFLDDE